MTLVRWVDSISKLKVSVKRCQNPEEFPTHIYQACHIISAKNKSIFCFMLPYLQRVILFCTRIKVIPQHSLHCFWTRNSPKRLNIGISYFRANLEVCAFLKLFSIVFCKLAVFNSHSIFKSIFLNEFCVFGRVLRTECLYFNDRGTSIGVFIFLSQSVDVLLHYSEQLPHPHRMVISKVLQILIGASTFINLCLFPSPQTSKAAIQ